MDFKTLIKWLVAGGQGLLSAVLITLLPAAHTIVTTVGTGVDSLAHEATTKGSTSPAFLLVALALGFLNKFVAWAASKVPTSS